MISIFCDALDGECFYGICDHCKYQERKKIMFKIKSIREGLQCSQSELANKFEIPVSSIANWEQGRSNPPAYVVNMMIRICQLESELALAKRESEAIIDYAKYYICPTCTNNCSLCPLADYVLYTGEEEK